MAAASSRRARMPPSSRQAASMPAWRACSSRPAPRRWPWTARRSRASARLPAKIEKGQAGPRADAAARLHEALALIEPNGSRIVLVHLEVKPLRREPARLGEESPRRAAPHGRAGHAELVDVAVAPVDRDVAQDLRLVRRIDGQD